LNENFRQNSYLNADSNTVKILRLQHCKQDVSKSTVTALRFAIDDKPVSECGKALAQDVFDRRWSPDGVKTLIKISECHRKSGPPCSL